MSESGPARLQHVKPCCPDCGSKEFDALIFREVSEPASITGQATCENCENEFDIDYAAVSIHNGTNESELRSNKS